MRKILYILCFCLLSFEVRAGDYGATWDCITETLDFGKFVQLDSDEATVTVSVNNGTVSRSYSSNVITTMDPVRDTSVRFIHEYDGEVHGQNENLTLTLNPEVSTTGSSYCSANISEVKFDTPSAIPLSESQTVNVGVGAKLTVSHYCKEGAYSGAFVISYGVGDDNGPKTYYPVRIPFTFEVIEPLSVTKKDAASGDMNFGMYITPTDTAYITLTSSGVTTSGGTITSVGQAGHGAILNVSGVQGRRVLMDFGQTSMLLYLNGNPDDNEHALTVDNFQVYDNGSALPATEGSTTRTFNLPSTGNAQANKDIVVGATLTVTRDTAPGTYTNSITVTFVYNDYF